MVTIQDVAKAAGVSPMTVSHVINDHPHVAAATREKVLTAINDLDYRVNVAARNLRQGRTGTIGLAVPEVDRPYYGQLAARIIAQAGTRGFRVVVEQTGSSRESELDALALSRNRLYDGLILSTVGLGPADTELLKVDYPVVILGERIFEGPVDHVAMPNVEGARAATQHLIEQGSRRIVMLEQDAAEVDMSSLRFDGYRAALRAAGIEFDPKLVVNLPAFSMDAGAETVQRLVREGLEFDGLFGITDTVAIGALRGLIDAGVDVPGQVRVIGFDNVDETRFLSPSLSSVDPDHDEMARTAVELLVRRMNPRHRNDPPQEFVSRFTVMARESTVGRP